MNLPNSPPTQATLLAHVTALWRKVRELASQMQGLRDTQASSAASVSSTTVSSAPPAFHDYRLLSSLEDDDELIICEASSGAYLKTTVDDLRGALSQTPLLAEFDGLLLQVYDDNNEVIYVE